MPTISFLFCFWVFELHHLLAANEKQNKDFYEPFHKMVAVLVVALWVGLQKVPERFMPEARKLHIYFSSTNIKSFVVILCLFWMHLLMRDALIL
jgi:hypothetical protein